MKNGEGVNAGKRKGLVIERHRDREREFKITLKDRNKSISFNDKSKID